MRICWTVPAADDLQNIKNYLQQITRSTSITAHTIGASLNFTQTCLSLSVKNDGCPISARFWQMWDSTNVDC